MVQLHDKQFIPFISKEKITEAVQRIAQQIDADYAKECPLLIGILNGSFIFAADLFRALSIHAEITFVKLNSYLGDMSSGKVATEIGLQKDIKGHHVIILEDIIDTGATLAAFLPALQEREPLSIKIASLLVKPSAEQYGIRADYVGFEIPAKFVVGYGLDYDGLGRNLSDLHIHSDQ